MAAPRTLAELRDIHLPPPPGEATFDPLWLAAAALLCAAALVAWALRRRRQRVLRQSLRELAAAERACAAGGDTAALARTLSRLLRRHALRRDARAASLVGEEWLEFLDAHAGKSLSSPSTRRTPGPRRAISLDSGFRRNDEAVIGQRLPSSPGIDTTGAGAFAHGPGAGLAELPYRPAGAGEPPVAELVELVKRWLRSNP